MKRRTVYLLLLVLAVLLSSCGLKRGNPLDPSGNHNVEAPMIISDLEIYSSPPGAANKYVEMRWTANPPYNTDGYFVYRAIGYFSTFAVVDTVYTNNASHGSKPWHRVMPGQYWYKISAFKQYPAGRLEGRACEPTWVEVRP